MQRWEDSEETKKNDGQSTYLTCPHCLVTLRHRGALQTHLKSHQPRKCRHCGKLVFKTENQKSYASTVFQNHERDCFRRIQRELKEQQRPKGIKKYHCKACNKTFGRAYDFQKHTCTKCVHCNQKFQHMRAAKNHKCPSLKHLESSLVFTDLKDLEVKYVCADS